jgi:large subunit ribosomal protein L6
MSNIGKQTIQVPENIEVRIKNSEIWVKGKLGELNLSYDSRIAVTNENNCIKVQRTTDKRKDRELHGLYRALINNMIEGVSNGFQKELHLVGVGYTADKKGDFLLVNVGFSHPIYFEIPNQISIDVLDPTTILIKGFDKQNVGDMAAKIRSVRKPEPYKGKGIKYSDEFIRRKAGKVVGGAA